MATLVDRKGPIQGPSKRPQNSAMEVIAEEMIDGIFCHYEPPDDSSRYKSILRRPKSRRAHRDASVGSGSGRRRVRWSDEPKGSSRNSVSVSETPFAMRCLGGNCMDAAVEAGIVSPGNKDENYYSHMDYDLRSFSEDSGVKPRQSRAHHHVMFDDNGNPVPTKPGVRVDPPPRRPPPKKREMFIPELCGVRIGYDEDDDDEDDDDESSRYYKKKKKPSSSSSSYQRPNHTKYRPSYEYREDEENSIVTEEMALRRRQQEYQQGQTPPPPPPPTGTSQQPVVKRVASVPVQNTESLPPPPPPPPPPRSQAVPDNNNVHGGNPKGDNGIPTGIKPLKDFLEEYRDQMETTEQDWGSQDSIRVVSHPVTEATNSLVVTDSKKIYSSGIEDFCGNSDIDCKDDWDRSIPTIPCLPSKKWATVQKPEEPPKLDAPDSRDSQEENKPLRYTPNAAEPEESEVGTELTWHSPTSPTSKRRSLFKRGRNRDKRQSTAGRVEVIEDEGASTVSKTNTPRSFLGFRSRSKSPGRKRIFGRSRTSENNSEVGDEDAQSQVQDDVDKQSFIGAYRDSMDATDSLRSQTITSLHPAHPLNQTGNQRMSKDEMMERQSFITAHRESMDSGEPRVQTITERLRRFRAQKALKNGMSGPVDLDDDFDDEMFERQSMITAHRNSFEPERERKSMVRVRRIRSKDKQGWAHQEKPETENKLDVHVDPDIPEHLKHLHDTEIKEEERELTWEERTQQAWDRIRSGLGLTTEENTDKVEVAKESEEPTKESTENGVSMKTDDVKPDDGAAQEEKEDAKQEDDDSKETLVEETPSALEALANLFVSSPKKSTTPLKSILKSPSSEKRVTFGEDQERVFHKDQDENQPESPPPVKRSFLGKLVKKGSPSTKKNPLAVILPGRDSRSPLQPSPNPQQQRSPSPMHPVPLQRSPSPMQHMPFMYPPYPQQYPPHMMPVPSPMNAYPMAAPPVSGDPSSLLGCGSAENVDQMPTAPTVSSDSSQSLQHTASQPQYQQQMPMHPYMMPQYYYGYPYMYPPPGAMPMGGMNGFPEDQKKKKKRVFRGRKLLGGVLTRGRNSLGGGTMSSSMSMEEFGNGDTDTIYDESVYSVAEPQS